MLFNVEEDSGSKITGYVVPDGFSMSSTIRVCVRGDQVAIAVADERREALVLAGRHETGKCGFTIDSRLIGALTESDDLELFDAETNILVYRRHKHEHINKKLVRIETHLFPLWGIDAVLEKRFQYSARAIENYGRETITQLFLLNDINSIYLGGKILYRNYAHSIESGFETIIVLQDPYEELAERLLVLSKIRSVKGTIIDARERAALAPVIEFAENLPIQDEKAFKRAIRRMPDNVVTHLVSPLVRQLTVAAPDDMPGGGAVAAALDVLAGATIVGDRAESASLADALGELLEIDANSIPRTPRFATVPPLAQFLREIREVEAMLEADLELYHYIQTATKKAS